MNSPRRLFLIFAAALAGITLAMGWITWQAIELERGERQARADSRQQESIRLSLWRMDSLLTAILARESARPYFEFQPFYPAQRAYTRMFEPVQPGEVLVPSPLLAGDDELVRLYFQLNPDGRLTSPQSPVGNMRDLAESAYVEPALIMRAESDLEALANLGLTSHLDPARSLAAARAGVTNRADSFARELASTPEARQQQPGSYQSVAEPPGPAPQSVQSPSVQSQAAQTAEEYAARQRQAELSNRAPSRIAPPPQIARAPGSPASTSSGSPSTSRPGPESDARSESELADRTGAAPQADAETTAAFDQSKPSAESSRKSEAGRATEGLDRVSSAGRDADPQLSAGARAAPAPADGERDSKISSKAGAAGPTDDTIALAPAAELEQGPFHAVWIRPAFKPGPGDRTDPELLFIRRVQLQSQELHQGLWLDWPAVRDRLLASVADLLPLARLEPIPESRPASPDEVGRLLATIPARLVPGPAPQITLPWWTPRRATLLLSWIAMIGAGLTVFSVLSASIALSERRGRFVSAVTHELRTPLTTFCLYSQMLADGMVTDEDARRQYLDTLKSESRRLARVVEDVLDYARLSRPKPRKRPDAVAAADLLDHCLPELRRRAQRAGLSLVEELTPLDPRARLHADPRSVERILLNLVDNACKYAGGPDRRLHLRARADAARLTIELADHGPGVPDSDAARIFQPFERGRSAEHQSEPGLGLGLALSRGIAAELGGDLTLAREREFGAVFRLVLPLL